ncbi:TraB/GumN family protein [Neolewinella antarctica]|uniref:TraB/GumN family protein n=1 Tax=Neolewinella antarctica TaxID=442734 RepID=A0ABX0XC46_9BACT|nr:TraB/GumN family protein [Neolewinella antarctica]NJC26843.1 hypothetical protein [Neolewinella antarctica]
MRSLVLTFFSFVFIVSCSPKTGTAVNAQGSDAAVAAKTGAPGVNDTTLLWKITTQGMQEPSYLFGTIHLIPEEDYFMPDRVLKALKNSQAVVFEIDPRDMQDPGKMMGMLGKINMNDGSSLKDHLDAAQYETVKGYFDDSGLPFMFLERMKPMFLSAMVGQDANPMGGGIPGMGGMGGLTGIKSYEMELTEIAETENKSISGLESMDFQLSLFDSIPYDEQATMLYDAVVDDAKGEESDEPNQMDQMVDMYKRQAVAEMANIMKEEGKEMARFEELLLTKRNENWAPTIKAAVATTPTFYAVGAGHLGGAKGVIALLREAGVTVEPVY